MSSYKKMSIKELQERKKKLDTEIKLLEQGFSNKASGLKEKLELLSNPAGYVKKHPFKSVAWAAGAGLLVGMLKPKRKRGSSSTNTSPGRSYSITSVFLEELRHLAVRKAMHYLSDLIDQQMDDFKKKEK
jgi:ElaB/YqjD/DUF883 family membrane-anchored ribosome-binding protein